MKKIGFTILQFASVMILIGGIGDIILTYIISSIPQSHLQFLKISPEQVSVPLKKLDTAFMRAIGAFLIAVGVGAMVILYGPVKQGNKRSLTGLVLMITIAESNNAFQMYYVESPYYVYPLACVVLTWLGAILYVIAKPRELNS